GFLKIDLLGLGMLSAVERCVEEIARVRKERIDLSRIPYDDERTFRAIRLADTVGVFQIESRAQMQSLLRTRPRNLQDLTVQVAIVRPGPIQGGAVNPYIERRQRLREDSRYEIPYEHPTLEPVLAETLGTIIFQDQVMEVAEAFAGFSPGEAAALRRAMSRKRSHESMRSHRQRFLAGAREHARADERTAERVWAMIEGFAGFGFPKAHGAAFGLLAYQSTWLRVHYPAEFLCALLNEQPMGFYAPDSLVHEAQRKRIAVLAPDVNASHVRCTVERGGVRIGLGYIKGAAAEDVRALVAERERSGPFTGLGELASRVACTRATLEQLAWSGACDSLLEPAPARERHDGQAGAHARDGAAAGAPGATSAGATSAGAARRIVLWQLGIPARGGRAAPAGAHRASGASTARASRRSRGSGAAAGGGEDEREHTQLALPLQLPAAPQLRPLGRWQRLIADYSTSGLSTGEHAIAILRERLQVPMLATSAQLARLPSGSRVAVAGLVIARQRPGTARGTMFLLFEDEYGTINLVVPKAVYERHRHLARAEPLLLARGRLERSRQPPGPDESAGEIRPVINVLVRELDALERHLPGGDATVVEIGSSMRAVAPPVQSFAMGRRR
ncbi:MAG TPA: hypothetical protein VKV16_08520, partial [Solirubrobacteraceae bacterium]|nr:hypothetical protein [Solirubrobacteraceae bacterium]